MARKPPSTDPRIDPLSENSGETADESVTTDAAAGAPETPAAPRKTAAKTATKSAKPAAKSPATSAAKRTTTGAAKPAARTTAKPKTTASASASSTAASEGSAGIAADAAAAPATGLTAESPEIEFPAPPSEDVSVEPGTAAFELPTATAEVPGAATPPFDGPTFETPGFGTPHPGASNSGTPSFDTPAGPPPGAGGSAPWPNPEAPGGATGNRFFSWMRSLNIPRQPGWIGGVCAGIASRLGIDPLIVRGIFVVIAIFGGPALLLYAAGWLLLPDNRNKIHLEEVFRGHLEAPIAGIGAIVLLALLPVTQGFWFANSFYWDGPQWGAVAGRTVWSVIIIGLIVAFVIWIARRSKEGRSEANIGASAFPTPTFAAPASAADAATTTIPEPTAYTNPSATAFAAGASTSAPTASFAAGTPGTPTAPTAPLAPGPGAPHEEVAAWRAQQAQWKLEREAYRRQQSLVAQQVQQQARIERERVRQIERERNAATRSNPLYTFVVIGISLIAGALTTMALGGFVVAGLAAMLAVLAIGIIINGVRGKRGGGATGLAWIVIVALLIGTAVTRSAPIIADGSWTTATLVAADDARFDPRAVSGQADQTFAVGAGDVELDLRDYFADMTPTELAAQPANQVNLYVGSGDVDLLLPKDLQVNLDLQLGNGAVTDGERTLAETRGWRTMTYTAPGNTELSTLFVRIWVGNGDIDINRTLEIGAGR